MNFEEKVKAEAQGLLDQVFGNPVNKASAYVDFIRGAHFGREETIREVLEMLRNEGIIAFADGATETAKSYQFAANWLSSRLKDSRTDSDAGEDKLKGLHTDLVWDGDSEEID
jgi:hypothetical protein